MYQPLETYLKRIKSQLKGIPAAERELQIQEIAQHLQRMIAKEMEGGLSEADAVRAAIAQFGKPKEIGRGLRGATGGTKTGIWLGMAMGAGVGVVIIQVFWILALFVGLPYASMDFCFSGFAGTVLAALSGAVASLVGRRFTWRHLLRPSGRHAILGNWTRDVAICCRFFEVGMIRGGVGGAIYSAFKVIPDANTYFVHWNHLFFPNWAGFWNFLFVPNFPALWDFLHFFATYGTLYLLGAGVAVGAFQVGVLNAFIGLGLRAKEKREGRRAWLNLGM